MVFFHEKNQRENQVGVAFKKRKEHNQICTTTKTSEQELEKKGTRIGTEPMVTGFGLWLGLAPLLLALPRPDPEPFGRPLFRPVPRAGVFGASFSISPIIPVL